MKNLNLGMSTDIPREGVRRSQEGVKEKAGAFAHRNGDLISSMTVGGAQC